MFHGEQDKTCLEIREDECLNLRPGHVRGVVASTVMTPRIVAPLGRVNSQGLNAFEAARVSRFAVRCSEQSRGVAHVEVEDFLFLRQSSITSSHLLKAVLMFRAIGNRCVRTAAMRRRQPNRAEVVPARVVVETREGGIEIAARSALWTPHRRQPRTKSNSISQ